MRASRIWVKALVAGFPVVLLVLAWVFFAPTSLGGQTTYVITSGVSMEPGFHAGDLAILREVDNYQVGNVTAYRDPNIGTVLHRIIGREGNQFVLQGDNNDFIDPYRPTRSEMVGQLWIHLPSAGNWLETMRQPRNASVLATVIGALFMVPTPSKKEKRFQRLRRRNGNSRPPGSGGSASVLGSGGQSAATVLGVVGFAALLLAVLAFSQPTERSVSTPIEYEHTGEFEYSAPSDGTVYGGGAAATGQPVYRELSNEVNISFTYGLSSDTPAETSGTYRIDAVVSHDDGWSRTVQLRPTTPFTGNQITATALLEIGEVQAVIDSFEAQTGLDEQSSRQYSVSVVPNVNVEGNLGGQQLVDTFAPELSFLLNSLVLQSDAQSASAESERNPFRPTEAGSLSRQQLEPNQLSLLSLTVPVATAQSVAQAGLVLAALGGLVLLTLFYRASKADEPTRIQAKYGPWLIAVRSADSGSAAHTVIHVASFDDLVRIAERENRMILHQTDGSRHDYFVQDIDVAYRYRTAGHVMLLSQTAEENA